jgi:hypothetical protein
MQRKLLACFVFLFIRFSNSHAQSWNVTGNSGITTPDNFIGNTDSKPLHFRTNNLVRMIVDELGSVGIGTVTPQYKLDVAGSIHGTSFQVDGAFNINYPNQGAVKFDGQYFEISHYAAPVLSLKSTDPSGRSYWLVSGGGNSGVGAGNFGIFDPTAGEYRVTLNSAGDFNVKHQLGLGNLAYDPATSINGSIYYNYNWNQFKAYQNGNWRTLLTSLDGIQNVGWWGSVQTGGTSWKIDGRGEVSNTTNGSYLDLLINQASPSINGYNNITGSGLQLGAISRGDALYGAFDFYAIQPNQVTEIVAANKLFNVRTGNSFLFSIYGNGGVVLPKDNQHISIGSNFPDDRGTIMITNKNLKQGLPTSTFYENAALTVDNWNSTDGKLYLFTMGNTQNASWMQSRTTADWGNHLTYNPFLINPNGGGVVIGSTNLVGTEKLRVAGSAVFDNIINVGTLPSDPTGTNGAIYYNTSSNSFRAFKNGAWSDLNPTIIPGWALGGNTINPSTDFIGSNNSQPVIFKSTNEVFRINSGGQLIIGTDHAPINYKLAVNGDAIFNKIKVQLYSAPWADYVFDSSYALPSLDHVQNFIKENKHLEGVPTTQEIKENGIDLGANQAILLKKIEELTLYMIDVKKELERQSDKIFSQELQIRNLKKQLHRK